jgi:hypothetical protein
LQVVDGNRMVATQYDLSFRVDRDRSLLCKKTFSQDELKEFQEVRPCLGASSDGLSAALCWIAS